MTLSIQCLDIDAGDPQELVPDLLFVKVPEQKAGKNRLHLDLRPDDQESEVARLELLGAPRTSVGQTEEASPLTLDQAAEVARIRAARQP